MALTLIVASRNSVGTTTPILSTGSLQVPRVIGTVAIDTTDTKGFKLSQSGSGNQSPAAIVTFTGDADWTWNDTDAVAAASCRKVLAGVPYPVQCTPNLDQNFYMKTATTATIVAVMEA